MAIKKIKVYKLKIIIDKKIMKKKINFISKISKYWKVLRVNADLIT